MHPTNTFIDALYSKYCIDDTPDMVDLPQMDGHQRYCEFVGFDKLINDLKNVFNLYLIDLTNHNIKTFADSNLNTEPFIFKKLCSLNLSKNNLENWTDVLKITSSMPSLVELMLSSNPIKVPNDNEREQMVQKLNKLKTLIIGNVNYSWNDFLLCSIIWPNVEKLYLFENKIYHLNIPDDCLQNLKYLSLSKNPIADWNEISKLGKLKCLHTLEMPYCKIESISLNETDGLFPELHELDISYNQISDWKSVAELNKLPKLAWLSIKKNPVFDTNNYSHNFNYILGRVKNITKLDREPVTKELRHDAEIYYYRTIYLHYLKINTDPVSKNQFLEENPCFLKLLDKFGEPVVAKELTPEEKIKQQFSTLTILDEQNPDPDKRRIEKQVPNTLKILNLKFILGRMLNMGLGEEFSLIIKSKDYEEVMDDQNYLRMYRIVADSVIHVQRN